MKRLFILIAIMFFSLAANAGQATDVSKPPVRIPWLAAHGLFGYRNDSGKTAIAAQYADAQPFVSGFAVVAKDGHYGVINATGKIVVPFHYTVARVFSVGRAGLALLVAKREYNAWWHFWQWRVMPEFNLLGGSSGPFLVTKVPRAVWSVEFLPSRENLYSHDVLDETSAMGTHQYWKKGWRPSRTIPRNLRLSVYGKIVQANDKSWRITDRGRLLRLGMKVESITPNGQLLTKQGTEYRLANDKGKPLDDRVFAHVEKITFSTPEGILDVSRSGDMGVAYPRIPSAIYRDQQGRSYLYPDFTKPVPKHVSDYADGGKTIKAKRILANAVAIWDLPHESYFAVISTAAGKKRRLFLLGRDGQWNTTVPLYADPYSLLSGGRISFTGKDNRGILNRELHFYSLPLNFPVPCRQHANWYMGKDVRTSKYGVFDARRQRWQVPPEYDYLQDEIAPDVAVYSIVKKDAQGVKRDQLGLLDIADNKRITPPLYDRLEADGRVVRQVDGKKLSFYINRKTGFEYRSKAQP